MKITQQVTGYALLSRDIEVEIDDAKLEAALEATLKETLDDEEFWERPDDELWVDAEHFTNNCEANDDTLSQEADAIYEEWENLPDCVKLCDCNIEPIDEDDDPYYQACKDWLRSKGWAPRLDDDTIWFRKK